MALTLLAAVGSLHAAALVPVGAVLLVAGVSPGAVLAMLLVGPLPGVRGYLAATARAGMPRSMPRSVRALVSGPVIAMVSGFALNLVGERVRADAGSGLAQGAGNQPAVLAAGVLLLLFVWVLGRSGIREFLEPLRAGLTTHQH